MKSPFKRWTLERLGLIPVFFLSFFPGSYAQEIIMDPVSIALGGCYTTSNISAGLFNEAALGIADKLTVHMSHARPFVIKELGITSISSKFHLFPGNMKIGMTHYGIPGYQQINTSLGYGMKLSEMIYAGIGFRYYNTSSLGEWTYLRAIGISGGVLVTPGEKTLLAAHIINPITINNYPDYGKIFPSLLSIGIRQEIYESTAVYSEVMYSSLSKLQLKIAAEYLCFQDVIIRAGYHSNPSSLSFGSGINFPRFTMDIAFSYSMRIGVIPALAISYTPGR
ncbi:hypothetical protein ACFLQX_01170 [Bacteroidota bacterium]